MRLRYLVALALVVGVALVARDLRPHPENPSRAKEYAFLVYTTLAAVLYGVLHDQVTATVSPEYFLLGKRLHVEPLAFRWAVAKLAARASFGMGLLTGASLLVANQSRRWLRLGYRDLVRASLIPFASALLFAVAFGGIDAFLELGATTAREFVDEGRVRPFVLVWAAHAGSYAGALAGIVAAVVWVMARRAGLSSRR